MDKNPETPLRGLSKNFVKPNTDTLSLADMISDVIGVKRKETKSEKEARLKAEKDAKQARTDAKKAAKAKAIADGPKRNLDASQVQFHDPKENVHFEQRRLKAYLAGKPMFKFGFEDVQNEFGATVRQPKSWLTGVVDNTVTKDGVEQLLADGYTDPGCEFVKSTPGAKRTSHAEIKDRKFRKLQLELAKKADEANKLIKAENKGKKKADKKPLIVFKPMLYRPGSKAYLASKLSK